MGNAASLSFPIVKRASICNGSRPLAKGRSSGARSPKPSDLSRHWKLLCSCDLQDARLGVGWQGSTLENMAMESHTIGRITPRSATLRSMKGSLGTEAATDWGNFKVFAVRGGTPLSNPGLDSYDRPLQPP